MKVWIAASFWAEGSEFALFDHSPSKEELDKFFDSLKEPWFDYPGVKSFELDEIQGKALESLFL